MEETIFYRLLWLFILDKRVFIGDQVGEKPVSDQ